MNSLLETARTLAEQGTDLPFAVYSSVDEQHLVNIPIIKPVMVCVLAGSKRLGANLEISCQAGEFVFIANDPSVTMRNIPANTRYFAVFIEFEFEDFVGLGSAVESAAECSPAGLLPAQGQAQQLIIGKMTAPFMAALQQFVECSTFVPPGLWAGRRRELLQLLIWQGYRQIADIVASPNVRHTLHQMISADVTHDWTITELADRLAMSESTLRRKLSAEGTGFQAIKDGARLGQGLHLVQTTLDPIGLVAERCGYQSQSRFTDKFKQLFGMTPTDLRKTRERPADEARAVRRLNSSVTD
ncbi:helix-turn-helix transcriptional regulator [Oceanobacter mangrovi]|uniref:helix-turn-helix transcriptional regulator n=1 Tax=Oceanobacter mangrovi TaxID=2862510 RepID=UPI001C8CF4C0|nr:AraC family transcriptional regulator [Oceanobacter mangrovi]